VSDLINHYDEKVPNSSLKLVNSIPLIHPAVVSTTSRIPGTSSPSILVTTFHPFDDDFIYLMREGNSLLKGNSSFEMLTGDVKWPN